MELVWFPTHCPKNNLNLSIKTILDRADIKKFVRVLCQIRVASAPSIFRCCKDSYYFGDSVYRIEQDMFLPFKQGNNFFLELFRIFCISFLYRLVPEQSGLELSVEVAAAVGAPAARRWHRGKEVEGGAAHVRAPRSPGGIVVVAYRRERRRFLLAFLIKLWKRLLI